ncbi:hypothetical protein G6F22_014464 [Rhizopus arrhizus]|nr:hypothetical protein G6F22_014464 [Rhizopus arrhizus]
MLDGWRRALPACGHERLQRRRPSLSAEPLDAFDPDHRRQRQRGYRAGRAVLPARHRHPAGTEPDRGPGTARVAAGRPGDPGHEFQRGHHVRRGRRGSVRADPRTPPGPAGDPAHGLDPSEQRGGPGQGRCRRLPGQAVGRPQAADHGQQPAGVVRGASRTGPASQP